MNHKALEMVCIKESIVCWLTWQKIKTDKSFLVKNKSGLKKLQDSPLPLFLSFDSVVMKIKICFKLFRDLNMQVFTLGALWL